MARTGIDSANLVTILHTDAHTVFTANLPGVAAGNVIPTRKDIRVLYLNRILKFPS